MFGLFGKSQFESIGVNELSSINGKISVIDIREPYECSRGMLKIAKNIPMGQLLTEPDKYLKKEQKYYIVCQSGGRSSQACNTLSKQGFQVINVLGGMGSYKGKL